MIGKRDREDSERERVDCLIFRMIDVGSEWRTFSNDKDSKDMSRVGAAENPIFGSDNLETVVSMGTGPGAVDEFGKQKYNNGPRQVSSLITFILYFSMNEL